MRVIFATEELEERETPMGIGMQHFLGKSYFSSQRLGRWLGLRREDRDKQSFYHEIT